LSRPFHAREHGFAALDTEHALQDNKQYVVANAVNSTFTTKSCVERHQKRKRCLVAQGPCQQAALLPQYAHIDVCFHPPGFGYHPAFVEIAHYSCVSGVVHDVAYVDVILQLDLAQLPHELGVARKIGLAFPQTRCNAFGDHVALVAAKSVSSHGSDNLANSLAALTGARNIPGDQSNIALTLVVKGYLVYVVVRVEFLPRGKDSVAFKLPHKKACIVQRHLEPLRHMLHGGDVVHASGGRELQETQHVPRVLKARKRDFDFVARFPDNAHLHGHLTCIQVGKLLHCTRVVVGNVVYENAVGRTGCHFLSV